MRKLFFLCLAMVLLGTSGWFLYTRQSNAVRYAGERQVEYVAGPLRQAVGCVLGSPTTADIHAPVEMGLPDGVDVPADMAGQCYAFSVGFDPCTGEIQYADALTEFGARPCP